MTLLTPKQSQILDLIRASITEHGFPPTRLEIQTEMDYASVNAVQEHLKALERRGAIKIHAGMSRGIQVLV